MEPRNRFGSAVECVSQEVGFWRNTTEIHHLGIHSFTYI